MRCIMAILLGIGISTAASATPFVQSGLVYFQYISDPGVSWVDAKTAATTLTYRGATGYLATIASASENSAALNSFLLSSYSSGATSFDGAWLGGEDVGLATDTTVPGGNGYWQVGPLAGVHFSIGGIAVAGSYANWGGIEPNNAPSEAYMNVGVLTSGISQGEWADAVDGLSVTPRDPVEGYIVEFSPVSGVPDPGTWAMFISGLGLVGGIMRRRRGIAIRSRSALQRP